MADWLTNLPRQLQRNVSLSELALTTKRGEPPPWPAHDAAQHLPNAVMAVITGHDPSTPCPCCLLPCASSDACECWGCSSYFHPPCIAQSESSRGLPWHCPGCKRRFSEQGVRDVTLDSALMSLVCQGIMPHGTTPQKAHRVLRAAQWFLWDG